MINLPYGDNSLKNTPCVISVGVFDGLHLGHLKIIETNVELSRKLNAKSIITTFNINPKMFCKTQEYMDNIISDYEMNKILEEAGVDYHCIIDFSSIISKLSGEEFIAEMCTLYSIRAMVVGESFKCGNSSSFAGPEEISGFLSKYTSSAFLKVVPSVFVNNEEVSSSLIRRCLLTGDLEKVSRLLGRPYIPGNRVENVC